MQRLPKLEAGKTYIITSCGNNHEPIFIEPENYRFFLARMNKYLPKIGQVKDYKFQPHSFLIVLQVRPEYEIEKKYRYRIYQPLSNLMNSYSKSFNRKYGRDGSLFKVRFTRETIENNTMR
jgi:putative transposase